MFDTLYEGVLHFSNKRSWALACLVYFRYSNESFLRKNVRGIHGGVRGTVAALWTADQQVERSILHEGHVS